MDLIISHISHWVIIFTHWCLNSFRLKSRICSTRNHLRLRLFLLKRCHVIIIVQSYRDGVLSFHLTCAWVAALFLIRRCSALLCIRTLILFSWTIELRLWLWWISYLKSRLPRHLIIKHLLLLIHLKVIILKHNAL